jgi:hypothetical protein
MTIVHGIYDYSHLCKEESIYRRWMFRLNTPIGQQTLENGSKTVTSRSVLSLGSRVITYLSSGTLPILYFKDPSELLSLSNMYISCGVFAFVGATHLLRIGMDEPISIKTGWQGLYDVPNGRKVQEIQNEVALERLFLKVIMPDGFSCRLVHCPRLKEYQETIEKIRPLLRILGILDGITGSESSKKRTNFYYEVDHLVKQFIQVLESYRNDISRCRKVFRKSGDEDWERDEIQAIDAAYHRAVATFDDAYFKIKDREYPG